MFDDFGFGLYELSIVLLSQMLLRRDGEDRGDNILEADLVLEIELKKVELLLFRFFNEIIENVAYSFKRFKQ